MDVAPVDRRHERRLIGPVRLLSRLDRRRSLPRLCAGSAGSNRVSTPAPRTGSSTPSRSWCSTPCSSPSAFSSSRCSRSSPLHRRARGCWRRRRSSIRPSRSSPTPTCRTMPASSTFRTSARFSSSWPICFFQRASVFARSRRSSVGCAAIAHMGNYYVDMWRDRCLRVHSFQRPDGPAVNSPGRSHDAQAGRAGVDARAGGDGPRRRRAPPSRRRSPGDRSRQ